MKYIRLAIWLIVGITLAVVIGIVLSPIVLRPPAVPPGPRPPEGDFLLIILSAAKTIISLVNIVLILTLFGLYYRIYKEIKSQFTLGLLVLISVLLMYAITSNPLVHLLFGYYTYGLGPFTVLPDIFTTIALLVLLKLTLE